MKNLKDENKVIESVLNKYFTTTSSLAIQKFDRMYYQQLDRMYYQLSFKYCDLLILLHAKHFAMNFNYFAARSESAFADPR